ncbi:hypothetical protein N9C31_01110, partial [Gammaproteobacteria bacterium]|nr:hypothetical protein [Gammaproteobacteria bacterium]
MFLKIISSGLIAGFVYQYFLPMQFGIATIPLVGQTLIAATLFIASHVTLTMCSKLFNWLRGFTFASLVKESAVLLLSVISVYLPMTLVPQLAVYFMGLSLAINSILTLTAVTSVYGIFKFALGKLSKKAAEEAAAEAAKAA